MNQSIDSDSHSSSQQSPSHQGLQKSTGLYKGKRLRNQQNQNININDFIITEDVQNFTKYFYKNEGVYGKPTCCVVNQHFVIIGTQSSAILIFDHNDKFNNPRVAGIDYSKNTDNSIRGSTTQMEISGDDLYVFVNYSCDQICLYNLLSLKEIHCFKHVHKIKKMLMVPVIIAQSYLQFIGKDCYYEMIVLDESQTITKYYFEIDHSLSTIRREESILYKLGEVCSLIKLKYDRVAKIYDVNYQHPLNKQIIDISIMSDKHVADIQVTKDDEEKQQGSSDKINESQQGRKTSFLTRMFSLSLLKQDKLFQSQQFTLIAILFAQKVEVIKIWVGKSLIVNQQLIKIVLRFDRPDAEIYSVVFKEQPSLTQQCSCNWGLGSFKETNKRYAILLVNWSGKEFYAFKCMKGDLELQVVQGGHFYHASQDADFSQSQSSFISNSVFITMYSSQTKSQIVFMTSLQFEYGVPFSLSDISKHVESEKQIKQMNLGDYEPSFEVYQSQNDGQEVYISQGVMDSIRDGYQKGYIIDIPHKKTKQLEKTQYSQYNDKCYLLNGSQLYIITLKKWNEYLDELSSIGEWGKAFQDAQDILEGKLTMLSALPENDINRLLATKEYYCKLAFTFILDQLNNQDSDVQIDKALLRIMNFLFITKNEDYLFTIIEDIFLGSGKKEVFYNSLCDAILQIQSQGFSFHIRAESILKLFRELKLLDRVDIIQLIVFNLDSIDFDHKSVIDLMMQWDLIIPMVHICSQMDDFLTPYLKIMTVLQLKTKYPDDTITSLSCEELGVYALEYIQFSMTGQYYSNSKQKDISFFTDKQFKIMLKELFEYMFDLENLNLFLQINFKRALEVLLQAFSKRIQEVLSNLFNEGKTIHIRIPKDVEQGFLSDILEDTDTIIHLNPLRRIYVIIKQAELSYLSYLTQQQIQLDLYYDVSVAFTAQIVCLAPLSLNFNHVMLAVNRYLTILREQNNPIFDIQWVLKGRVQKKIHLDVIKNEFLWQLTEGLDQLVNTNQHKKCIQELLVKATQTNWIWMKCWCLVFLEQYDTAFQLLLDEPDALLSEKLFNILTDGLQTNQKSSNYIRAWILDNLKQLAQLNSSKLFSLLLSFYKQEFPLVINKLIQIPLFEIEQKIHVSLAFFDFLFARTPFNQLNPQLKSLHTEAIFKHKHEEIVEIIN